MLPDRRVHTTLPVSDLDRTRRFYEDTLGFKPIEGNPAAILYRAGEGTVFAITRSSGKAAGTHTQRGSQSRTSPGEVADLKGRGVVFEEYDTPGLKTVD